MNKLDLAEALIAIADTGSIHRAATKLHQTNAAISKKLTKLELHLATQLVHRERKGLRLTEAGQRYYHEAKKALLQFSLAEKSVAQATMQPRGELKVALNQYYAERFILPKLPNFLRSYPGITVNLDIAEVFPDFNSKKMDILFGVSVTGADNLVRKKIATTRYVLCASPNYLKRNGLPNSSTELLKHNYIAHSTRKPYNVIMLDNDESLVLKPTLLINNTQMMIESALVHLGFIWTHENFVSDLISKKKLICFMEKYTRQCINIYVYYEHQHYRDPKTQAFMEYFSK